MTFKTTEPSRKHRSAFSHWAGTAFIFAAVSSYSASADAQQLRFTDTTPGGILAIGNTLGLSKAEDENGPGTYDSIGTFISLDPASVDNDPLNASNPYPAGTTADWTQNGSTAMLTLGAGHQVLYAELLWSGGYYYGGEDVTANYNDPVTLSMGTASISVMPDADTALTLQETSPSSPTTDFAVNYYLRSADVTDFVKAQGSGTYAVSGVPATQDDDIDSLNAAGWTLMVAYRGDDQPIRNLTIFVGGSFVDEDSRQDYTVDGFCAPPSGPVEGKVMVSALEGDANLTGDSLAIAATTADTFVNLSGPNNPVDNFFASQINDRQGALDTNGSFGDSNHDAMGGTNTVGGRQSWDLTTIALSAQDGHLSNAQTSAVLRTETEGDSYMPTAMALEIDVKAPDFSDSSTLAEPAEVMVDDSISVTATIKNSGEAPANDMSFVLALDPGLELLAYNTDSVSGDSEGNTVTASALAQGVPAGTLQTGNERKVTMTLKVNAAPQNGNNFVFKPTWDHNFVVCDGDPSIAESHSPDSATVAYDEPDVGAGVGGMGTTTTGVGGMGGAGGDGVPQSIKEESGCGCRLPGGTDGPAWPVALLLGVLGAGGLRRRRTSARA